MAINISEQDVPLPLRRGALRQTPARLTARGYIQIGWGVTTPPADMITAGVGIPMPLNVPAGAEAFVINVEGQSIRYRDDGGSPDLTSGELYPAGSSFSRTLRNLRTVRLTGIVAGAIANISFYAVYQELDGLPPYSIEQTDHSAIPGINLATVYEEMGHE